MARDYEPMLDLADELEGYNGFLTTARMQERNRLLSAFAQKRREFVYDLIKEADHPSILWPSVTADLDRIAASGQHYDGAIYFTRDELEKHIAKQADSHPLMRFATRWALPVAGVIGMIAYAYFEYLKFNS